MRSERNPIRRSRNHFSRLGSISPVPSEVPNIGDPQTGRPRSERCRVMPCTLTYNLYVQTGYFNYT
jgi:hypothetical protein